MLPACLKLRIGFRQHLQGSRDKEMDYQLKIVQKVVFLSNKNLQWKIEASLGQVALQKRDNPDRPDRLAPQEVVLETS